MATGPQKRVYGKASLWQRFGLLFDYLVSGGVLVVNPAAAVRGPLHVVSKGKTPVLLPEEARQLLDAIDVSTISGLARPSADRRDDL